MTDAGGRSSEITAILDELERVWRRNPDRAFGQLAGFATSATEQFTPFDATDSEVLTRLRSVAPGQPAPPLLV